MSDQPAQAEESRQSPERAMPPIRWPHPGRTTLALIGVWVLGMLLAVFVPALIVPPGVSSAEVGPVLLAFGCTVAGSLVMVAVGWLLHRKYDEPLAWSFGLVPAITVTVGGIIMMATKLGVG
jgi:hypothetical protein